MKIDVTLKCSSGCQEDFEEALREKGWSLTPVSEPSAHGELLKFSGDVWVQGSARGVERRAIPQLQAVAESAGVGVDELRARRALTDFLEPVIFTIYRYVEVGESAGRCMRLRARLLNFIAVRFGTRDVGDCYSGSRDKTELPPEYSGRPGFARRQISGPSEKVERYSGDGEMVGRLQERSLFFAFVWWVAMLEGVLGLLFHVLRGESGVAGPALVAAILAVGAHIVRLMVRVDRPRPKRRGVTLGVVFCFAMACISGAVSWMTSGAGDSACVFIALAVFIGTGVWMLLQGWKTAPLMTAIVGLVGVIQFAAIGLFLRGGYLLAFKVDPAAVEVTPFWVAIAAFRVILTASFFLVVPAVIGYLRHFHMLSGRRMIRCFALLEVLVLALILFGPDATYLNPSSKAGDSARSLAVKGDDPAPYFGINPDWRCVQFLTSSEKVDSDGGIVDPSRPYLVMGSAGGRSQLWNGEGRQPISVDDGQVRLLPRKTGRGTCPAAD